MDANDLKKWLSDKVDYAMYQEKVIATEESGGKVVITTKSGKRYVFSFHIEIKMQ